MGPVVVKCCEQVSVHCRSAQWPWGAEGRTCGSRQSGAGVSFPELSWSGMSGLIKCPLHRESVSSTENILAFLDLLKKKKLPTKQKIIPMKFKSGLLIYNYICVCVYMCVYVIYKDSYTCYKSCKMSGIPGPATNN